MTQRRSWQSVLARGQERLSVGGDCDPLTGRVDVEGAKNIALPLLTACCLLPGETTLCGLPEIFDVDVQVELLRQAGSRIDQDGKTIRISTAQSGIFELPHEVTLRSRGAIYAACVPLCRMGRVRFKGFGGDALRGRSLEPHMRAFAGFGFAIETRGGWIDISGRPVRGAEFALKDREAGVTASALALLLAAMVEGRSVIAGVSREPEVLETAHFLRASGASVHWDGNRAIIDGPAGLKPTRWQIPPDRVVWGTFAAAAAATGGTIELPLLPQEWLDSIVPVFENAGISVATRNGTIVVSGRPLSPVTIETGPFPRFPSDLGPPMVALMAMAPGISRLVEQVYPDRFDHIRQLSGSGLAASLAGNMLTIKGGRQLQGGVWRGSGIRESAALLLSGLVAAGESTVTGVEAIARGYEDLPARLNALGARISQLTTKEPS